MKIIEFLIDENMTIIEAMNRLNELSKKVLFVVKNDKLVASLTDGDIRRWILKKGNLDAQVRDVANYSPKYLYEHEKDEAMKYMKEYFIEALPILNSDRNIETIILINDEEIRDTTPLDLPVVIMAGGKGTRLYPYTKILPKPLIPIGDIPIVEHIMNRFYYYGCNDFYLILNHKKEMIKAYFSDIKKEYNIFYFEENKPLGTGGGLSLLKNKINKTFVLSNCDILINENIRKIFEFHKEEHNFITMVCSLKKIKIPYGVIEFDSNGEIIEMKEKPELSFFTNTGIYIVEPEVLKEVNENESISFPEIIDRVRHKGKRIGIYPISEESWSDMGEFEEMEKMKRKMEKRDE